MGVVMRCFFLLTLNFAPKSSLMILWTVTSLRFTFMVILRILLNEFLARRYLTQLIMDLVVTFSLRPHSYFLATVPWVSHHLLMTYIAIWLILRSLAISVRVFWHVNTCTMRNLFASILLSLKIHPI
uniref:Uncharacterized protein n=1 Tax=Lepeophtheirus salmonis TaxID=72036 RepID=A0A0K2T035_LEPSM